MNLQHAKNNPGKFQTMQGTATKFDIQEGDYGPYALGTLKDNLGNEEKVLFAAKKDESLPDRDTCMNSLGIWGVKYDANTGNFKAYYNGPVAKQLQGSPQSPQNEPESTNPPQQGSNDVEIRKCLVCAYIPICEKPLIENIEYWMEYIKTGKDASLPGNKNDNSPRTDQDGVPF